MFDATTNECRKPEDIKPMPPAPDCASWDDDFRPIFEDILTDAVEEEEPETEKPPVVDEVMNSVPLFHVVVEVFLLLLINVSFLGRI